MHLFDACPKLYFGENALDRLLELPPEKALVVTDPYMVRSGAVRTVTGRLDRAGIDYAIFSDVEPDPAIETVAAGLQCIFREKPETVIALGGGSAIDACKAMLYFCMRFKGVLMGGQYVHEPRFVAIPTTSGTGSEVTSYAVVTDRQRGVKIPLSHRSMIPDEAILDADYTKTLPPDLIAFTGMDVLTHAVEAYVSPKHNDFTDMCARDAARKVLRYLPAFYSEPENRRAREKMFNASTLAGLAFTNSGLGVCHGIAHTVGAEFHLPHGKANAMILPYVVAFNAGLGPWGGRAGQGEAAGRYADLSHNLRLDGPDIRESCRRLVAAVQVLGEQFGVPVSLEAAGVAPGRFRERRGACADKILADACTGGNPVPVSREDVLLLLDGIFSGGLAY